MPEGILIVDLDGAVVVCNRRFKAIWNLPEHWDELPIVLERLKIPMHQVKDAEAFRRYVQTMYADPEAEGHLTVLLNDGRYLELYSLPYRTEDSHIIGRVWSYRDVTAQKCIEERLRESEDLYRTLVSASPDAVTVVDLQRQITFVSQKTLEIFGCADASEILGGDVLDWVAPEDRERAIKGIGRAMQGSLSQENRYTLLRKDGTRFTGEITSVPLHKADGSLAGMISVTRDVTERIRVAEALRESEERFRLLANATFEGILIHEQGQVRDANRSAAAMFAVRYKEAIGKNIFDFIAPEARDLVRDRIASCYEGSYEFEALRFDGTRFPVEVLTRELPYAGKMLRVVAIRDITERKRAEAQRRQLFIERERARLLERFIGDASHDLRTPLSTVKVSLSVLRKTSDAEKQQRHLDIVESQTAHLEKLLEDILRTIRLDRDHAIERKPFDLNLLVQDVVAEHSAAAERKQHKLIFLPAATLPVVQIDGVKLSRAVAALVLNAVNYTPDGGSIIVRTRLDDGEAIVEVEDNGVGIAPEDLLHVFDRFYRADAARRTETGGMGLGLTIARKIVQEHQGLIEVESTPDEGSVFRVVLPIQEEA